MELMEPFGVKFQQVSASFLGFLLPFEVAIEYITALEGPFWRKIRGKGHASGP